MDSNTHSTDGPDRLGAVVTELQVLAAQDRDGLPDGARAERLLTLRGLVERLEGQWLAELADLDARGPPAPTRASRPPPPPAGSGTGCAWVPAPPPASCAPPEPCTVAR